MDYINGLVIVSTVIACSQGPVWWMFHKKEFKKMFFLIVDIVIGDVYLTFLDEVSSVRTLLQSEVKLELFLIWDGELC